MKGLSRKEQIKWAAASMFRKRGFKATSMRDIAAGMGMEAPSLYNHISSKQEILSELLMTIAHHYTDGMEEIKHAPLTASEKLERLIKLHVDIAVDHTDAVSLLINEWVHLEGPIADEFNALKDGYEKDFKGILAQSLKERKVPEVDVDLALFSILSTLRWLYSWYSRNPGINRIELEQQMVRLLVPR
ncbi:MAG: TetR/AcrR family transcriptional regulator [Flavobacteriales bacterium]|nr:TetR/AcrR family transcriptional regulator [Flavobacteriales bacterium]